MSGSIQMVDRRIPGTVVLRIDHAASPADRKGFIERMDRILPHLNWRTHFFIVSEGSSHEMEFARQIIRALARFLIENGFVTFYAHPLIRIGASEGTDTPRWKAMLDDARPFQQQAYEKQTEARLLILPIIDSSSGTTDQHWMKAARSSSIMPPSPRSFSEGRRHPRGRARQPGRRSASTSSRMRGRAPMD